MSGRYLSRTRTVPESITVIMEQFLPSSFYTFIDVSHLSHLTFDDNARSSIIRDIHDTKDKFGFL